MTASTLPADPVERRLRDPLVDCRGRDDGIGYVGPDVPQEVLVASGRPFGHLPWSVDAATGTADQWLESSFPFWARSIVEQWHDGAFDELEHVVFSRADDASQRLYYYVAELQRRGKLAGPQPCLLDLAMIGRPTSEQHTVAAIEALMQVLDVAATALLNAIERCNPLRLQLAQMHAARDADGVWYERLGRAALWSHPLHWLQHVEPPVGTARRTRVLLAGSMPPDERLHQAAEAAGSTIVAEAHAFAGGRLEQVGVPASDPPACALARFLRGNSVAPRAFLDRAAWLLDRARAVRADAVILWLTREDEALAWAVPAQREALAAAGLRGLVLTAGRWQADDGAIERVSEFCAEVSVATA